MKHLKPFALFEAQASNTLSPQQQDFLDRYTEGTWSVNPATGLVDVQGKFNCYGRGLKSLYGIQFGQVTGDFWCNSNLLTSLAGAPQTVVGSFYCDENLLTSLVGAPQTVAGGFNCDHNLLTSLEGAPQKVGGEFDCDYNQLTSLAGAPKTVKGGFYCSNNLLTSLAGAPQTVEGHFLCSNNQLISLVGAPQTVTGGFVCYVFQLKPGQWNLAGWSQVLRTGSTEARKLIPTLPYLQPQYWLDLHRSDRQKFNARWLPYRQDPEVRSTTLWQQVEQALSGRAQSNLDDLELLKGFT